jgi:hypothetical protein
VTSYPSPEWGHIDAFCEADGWDQVRMDTGHYFWTKALDDGTVLQTHRSMDAGKRIAPNVFTQILRRQLQVSKDQFGEAIRTRQPVDRPTDLGDAAPEYEGWVVQQLVRSGLSEDAIRQMTPDEAKALVYEQWSRPSDG